MTKFLTFCLAILMCGFIFTACKGNRSGDNADEAQPQKALVLYYSQTGATKAVAEQIANSLNADIEEIVVTEPYSGTYQETIERCMRERMDSIIPAIEPLKANLADYDVVFIGYPIWFGTYARPIYSLVDAYDFDGKTIVPFCTFGSGGLEVAEADMQAALPKADVVEGYGVRNARITDMPEEVDYFLKSAGYLDGEYENLPFFSEAVDVDAETTAIFDAACGDYQFPLGTPVKVCKRDVPQGVEYYYNVVSKSPDGTDVSTAIYVLVKPDQKPVFTRVVRDR